MHALLGGVCYFVLTHHPVTPSQGHERAKVAFAECTVLEYAEHHHVSSHARSASQGMKHCKHVACLKLQGHSHSSFVPAC